MTRIDLAELRRRRADELAHRPLDVLVVGGGIVGAGIARDAAFRGLRTGLVEQHDLASGTSSRSSRLLHGGIRYLAQGRIGLVLEASREKRVLHRIAPHLAEPLAFVFPTYRRSRWPLWKLRVGVKLYDLLCGGRNLGASSSMGPDATLRHVPGLQAAGLTGAVRYYDGLTSDARLVLDTLRSAAAHGAIVANYTRLEEAAPRGNSWECRLRDVLAGRTFDVEARSIVNATGPWMETLPQASIRLRLTKGVHLVVDRARLPVPDAVVMTDDRRILFAIPWGERVILGTTDTDYDGPLDDPRTEPADVAYILGVVGRAFPAANLGPPDVRATWAGLRPLVADRRGGPSDISRAHQIRMPQPGWLDVAGGKLTTYRRIAQQAVDRLVAHLGCPPAPCRTAITPLSPCGRGAGGEGAEVLKQLRGRESGILPPEPGPELVQHFCTNEWAVHLDDVMLRRTSWHYYRDDARQLAQQVAQWMAAIFGWEAAETESEQARYQQLGT